MNRRWAAYVRVSTADQARSGLGLEAQRANIDAAVTAAGDTVAAWYTDAGVSATVPFERRPGARAMLDALVAGEVDGIVVYKLDRMARSTVHAAQIIAWANENDVAIRALDLGVDLTTPAGRFVASVLAAAAQFELEIIASRQRDAHAARRARGTRSGVAADAELRDRIVMLRDPAQTTPVLTFRAIADLLNAEGVPTVGGGTQWRASSVQAAAGYRRPGKVRASGEVKAANLPKVPRRGRGVSTAVARPVTEAAA